MGRLLGGIHWLKIARNSSKLHAFERCQKSQVFRRARGAVQVLIDRVRSAYACLRVPS